MRTMKFIQRLAAGLMILSFVSTASACVRIQKLNPGSSQTEFFRPPTLVPTSLPPTPTLEVAQTQQGLSCVDNLSFVSDVTIPDGTEVAAGSTMDKRWEVKNSGTCNWGEGYTLRLIAGSEMGIGKDQALPPARSGSQIIVRIVFTAPAETGPQRSAWQAFNPQGQPFGDPFFIEIDVEEAQPEATPSPQP